MTSLTSTYAVDLEIFQGPLDLLLYLIRKDEIDIYDIPIKRITEQYLQYVEMLKLLNLENAGDYILMAATLIRIKAQMLLPRESRDEDELDPREELTKALLEYRKFKEAGDILREKYDIETRLTPVGGFSNGYRGGETILKEDTSLYDLLAAFHEVMAAFKEEESYLVNHQDISVEDRIEIIRGILAQHEYATFEKLFADIRVKIIAIMTFLAVLELARNHRIRIHQVDSFSEIRVYPTELIQMPLSHDVNEQAQPVILEEAVEGK